VIREKTKRKANEYPDFRIDSLGKGGIRSKNCGKNLIPKKYPAANPTRPNKLKINPRLYPFTIMRRPKIANIKSVMTG
jgi:hypothetical protein